MNDLAALLASFDVTVLFDVIKQIANTVGAYLSPTLLVVAIYIRLVETQVDALVSGGKYGTAMRDVIIWSFVLGVYFSLGSMVTTFFNPIYAWLEGFGSLNITMTAFADLMAKNKIAIEKDGLTVIGVLSTPYALMAMLGYYSTLVVLAFLTAFLKIANVMVFGVAFVWGLIAIPVSISTTFKILRGWAFLCAFALVWPILQGLLMGMFTAIFVTSSNSLMLDATADATVRAANIMMLFSVMHLLLCAVMVSAPFIANALVTNTSAAAGVVMPFVGAAVAAGTSVSKTMGAKAPSFGGGAPGAPKAGMNKSPTANFSASKNSPLAQQLAADNKAATTAAPPMGGAASTAATATGAADATGGAAPAGQAAQAKKERQRRRGVILNQQRTKA